MNKRKTVKLGLVLIIIVLAMGGFRASIGWLGGAGSSAGQVRPARAQSQCVPLAAGDGDVTAAGQVVTQTLTLHAGWNAIYLEVEPNNPSPLVDPDGDGELPPAHEKSTLEAVFAGLNCDACLESVWTWNVPLSRIDYIVDPSEGLWDEPGWKRYFPATSVGPDGTSRQFLTNLLSLHANRGYLVKLKDSTPDVQLTVSGPPVPENHRWVQGSYNLAGFPIDPGVAPTVAAFTGGSPISEVRRLNTQGRWEKLGDSDQLEHGRSYLAYYEDQDADAPDDYTAPLNIMSAIRDGLQFLPGFAGRRQSVKIENLSGSSATVSLALVDAANAAVALQHRDSSTDPATLCDLKAKKLEITLAAGTAELLEFVVPSTEQVGDGQALLELASADLGTRWLIPLTAESGALAGLWVGEVVVNDVSEGRLGATNVEGGRLTAALRPRNESGISGAAELTEQPSGSTANVGITLTLALPAPQETLTPQVITGTAPYIGGYVYVDANQNGQPDATERGLGRVRVTLAGGSSPLEMWTDEDGAYLFEGLDPGTYTLALESQPPAGYTADFNVYLFKVAWSPFAGELEGLALNTPQTPSDEFRKAFERRGILLSDAATVAKIATDRWQVEDKGQTFTLFKRTGALQEVLFVSENPDRLANVWPVEVTVDADGVTRIKYNDDTIDDNFPRYDAGDNRVEPRLNLGYVRAFDAALWTGQCGGRLEKRKDLGAVKNGALTTQVTRAALNQGYDVDDQLVGGSSQYVIYVEEPGGGGAADQGVACGEVAVGAPTRFADGQGSEFRFRVLLRVKNVAQAGQPAEYRAELLPYYQVTDGPRVSSAAFSLQDPLAASADFGDTSQLLDFPITIAAQDALNPYKHKYHPDHDNLDAKFNALNFDTMAPHLWEAPEVRRRIQLELTERPPMPGDDEAVAAELDWGGATWGGRYQEVIKGIHKNDITVKGYFVIQHLLNAEDLDAQPFDGD